MGLKEQILTERTPMGGRCSVGQWMKTLSAKERKELEEVFADLSVPSTTISAYYRKHGVDISAVSFQRHRSNRCKCGVNNVIA